MAPFVVGSIARPSRGHEKEEAVSDEDIVAAVNDVTGEVGALAGYLEETNKLLVTRSSAAPCWFCSSRCRRFAIPSMNSSRARSSSCVSIQATASGCSTSDV